MGNEHEIRMVVATTHVDLHGEQFTKEDLEQMAEDARSSNRPRWLYWNHETTLPPIGHFGVERVELREDGEYQLLGEGVLFGEGWSEPANSDNVSGLDITLQEIDRILEPIVLSKDGHLVITYDTINYKRDLIQPIIESLNELVPTEEQIFRRKAEIPHEVIWVLVGFAGGIIARFGEKAADVITDTADNFTRNSTRDLREF